MAVRIKILITDLHEADNRQVEETMNMLPDGSEGLYKRPPLLIRVGQIYPRYPRSLAHSV